MSVIDIGPWVLLVLSCGLIGSSIYIAIARDGKGLALLLTFGVLLAGLSVHGLAFLTAYGDFLAVAQLYDQPTQENYAKAFDAIAKDELPPAYQTAVLSFAADNPTPELVAALEQAPSTPPLDALRREIVAQQKTAELAEKALRAEGRLNPSTVRSLDSTTRVMLDNQATREAVLEMRSRGVQP